MTNDPIEEFLSQSETNVVDVPSFCEETKESIRKLLALVRIYRQANQFYAQEAIPDIESGFAKSALEWGQHVVTWKPLTDLGNIARTAEEKAKEIVK